MTLNAIMYRFIVHLQSEHFKNISFELFFPKYTRTSLVIYFNRIRT